MPPFIDIHCHLTWPSIYSNLSEVIGNAEKAGVIMLTNGIDKDSNRLSLEISKKYSSVRAAIGLYPPDSVMEEKMVEEELSFIESQKDSIVAVGEIGLDYQNIKDKEHQTPIFVHQLRLAKKIGKPVIIHSRKAEKEVITILKSENMQKALLHCFHGSKSLIKAAVESNFFFSISTNVTRSEQTQMLVSMVPLHLLFAETDSPFLSPFKDKENKPAFVVESYKKIAEIKQVTIEELKNIIYMNWIGMFER